jgi:2-polyprenyl-6-hydroxyphenyl methylase / 3-demethylubiquinone-9 3-methyltransferase
MFKLVPRKKSQAEIFSSYNWWDQSCLLLRVNNERIDYIASCIDRAFGREALRQEEILEVGCGGGLICEHLALRGAVAEGIDPSSAALERAREHIQQSNLGQNVHFQQGYAEALPYANGSFSVIVSLDALEHVQDLNATIREIARVLAPGGIFIFDTINRTWIARLVLIGIGERLFQKNGLVPGLHDYHHFIKPHELHTILNTHHLRVQEIRGFMPRIIKGRLTLGPGWFKGVSYVGYALKKP